MPTHLNHEVIDLPHDEIAARVALACAGLNGHRTVGEAIRHIGSARGVITQARHHLGPLPEPIAIRIRQTPAALILATLELTRHHRMRLLTPDTEAWPVQLNELGCAAPTVLWVAGDLTNLAEAPIAITGTSRPTSEDRHLTVELATRLAGEGWTIAATGRAGVDQLVTNAAVAMGGRAMTVSNQARPAHPDSGRVILSENPPGIPLTLAAALRAHMLLGVLGRKTVVIDAEAESGAERTGIVAHALGRPLGSFGDRAGSKRLILQFAATQVHDAIQVNRLS